MTEINRAGSHASTQDLHDIDVLEEGMKKDQHVGAEGVHWKAGHTTFHDGVEHKNDVDWHAAVEDGKAVLGVYGSAKKMLKWANYAVDHVAPGAIRAPIQAAREGVVTQAAQLGARAASAVAGDTAAAGAIAGGALLGAAVATGIVVGGGVVVAYPVIRAFTKGDELRNLSDQDVVDIVTTQHLDLPEGFKREDIAKHHPDELRVDAALVDHVKAHLPELQAAADQGARAAITAFHCGAFKSPEACTAYLKAHPDVQEALEHHPAFNKGFEGVRWAAGRTDFTADEKIKDIEKKLDERDARANVPTAIRG